MLAQTNQKFRVKSSEAKKTLYSAEIARLKKLLRTGESFHMTNIAATYRMAGNRKRAFEWWRRAASVKPVDGDAFLELGYCYQYGIGVRKNLQAACRSYLVAIRSYFICEFSHEEAQYHLAIAYLDLNAGSRSRSRSIKLLHEAATDGDYPQADDLLAQLESGQALLLCRCRRELPSKYGGKEQCSLHRSVR